MFNPNGGPSFTMPAVGREAQHKAIQEYLTGGKRTPLSEPTTATTEPSEAEFDSLLAELANTLGSELDRVLPPNEIQALRADPVARDRFSKNLATSRALARRDDTRAAIETAKTAVAEGERETSRLAALGIAVGAAERGAAK